MKRITGGLILWALLATAAFGHSFNVALVVPEGARVQAMQAFLLASGERDRHANEESDGHLGGLDVYVSVVEMDADVAGVRENVVASQPDIIAVVGADLQGTGLEAMFEGTRAWVLPIYSVSPRAEQAFMMAGGSDFAARFAVQAGDPAGESARLVYIAARLIDLAVRAQGGAADRAALLAAIEGY